MKKRIFTPNGNKQIINSGWKTFDRQTNLITTGNCILNTQISSYIRPWQETECNGMQFEKGRLMNFDLEKFKRFRVPSNVLKHIEDKERKKSVCLYMFFVTDKERKIIPFGWALTSFENELIATSINHQAGQHRLKRINALDEAVSYITK